jgi:hypothetical protein
LITGGVSRSESNVFYGGELGGGVASNTSAEYSPNPVGQGSFRILETSSFWVIMPYKVLSE